MLIVLRGAEPLKRMLPDGTEGWYEGDKEICPIYREKNETCGMTTLAKSSVVGVYRQWRRLIRVSVARRLLHRTS